MPTGASSYGNADGRADGADHVGESVCRYPRVADGQEQSRELLAFGQAGRSAGQAARASRSLACAGTVRNFWPLPTRYNLP